MEILGKTADSQNGFRFKSNCIWLKLKWFWTELLEVEYFRTLLQSSSGDLTSGNSQLQHLPRNPPYLFVWLWPRFSAGTLLWSPLQIANKLKLSWRENMLGSADTMAHLNCCSPSHFDDKRIFLSRHNTPFDECM